MLLTFLRNHPYHYLGKKARPELPNEVKTTQCVAAPQERAQRAATQELGSHICVIWASNWPQFFHREMWRVLSYSGTAFTWLMQIMPALFWDAGDSWQPSYISCSSFWLFATSTSVRLQWQSWRQGDFYPKTTHHSGAGFDSSFGRLRFCCCRWHLQRGSAGLMCFFWISNQDSMGTWQQKFSSIKNWNVCFTNCCYGT